MPLTPADVHNVAFSKPPIGKRGYNEDEVDAFLDLVENELARLIEENSDLRQRVQELDQELAEVARAAVPRRSTRHPSLRRSLSPLSRSPPGAGGGGGSGRSLDRGASCARGQDSGSGTGHRGPVDW